MLLIVADDQGYNDLGLLGNGIVTPALDRLAREGVRLTNFYVAASVCTPSRGSLLTGRYPQRNGVSDLIRNEAPDYGPRYSPAEYAVSFERIGGMDGREVLLPEALASAGYTGAIYGKWDLGSLRRFLPTSRGFADFYGFVNTGIDYYTHERHGVPSMYRNLHKTEADRGVYTTDLFEREALRFLDERLGERRPGGGDGEPFLLYLPFNAPHSSSSLDPLIRSTVQAPEEYKAMYPPVPAETRTTAGTDRDGPVEVATFAARRRDYGGVGADNAPLRGKKGQLWEGGVRVTCLVRWPAGGVPAGAVDDALLSSLEIVPSLLAAAGAPAPAGVTLDGFDWWPTLTAAAPSPRTAMFWQRRDRRAARVGDWKWVDMPGAGGGLFDLSVDPGETTDLSAARPAVLARVRSAFAAWEAGMAAAEPRGPFRDY